MALNRKRLVFFERFFHPIAEEILGAQDDIELVRLHYATPVADNWAEMERACGYHIGAQTELMKPWFGTAELLARCPDMLALCSTGAGYDVIDVAAAQERVLADEPAALLEVVLAVPRRDAVPREPKPHAKGEYEDRGHTDKRAPLCHQAEDANTWR